ncbi:Electron transfer flavoprotein subunit alpha [Spatholobus suberectus]|nr:Electron transfer flavoprotein subunit alpha [Spatholobus suberectus]
MYETYVCILIRVVFYGYDSTIYVFFIPLKIDFTVQTLMTSPSMPCGNDSFGITAFTTTMLSIDQLHIGNLICKLCKQKRQLLLIYMAYGEFRAILHLAMMKDSKGIIAMKNDTDAPIFQSSRKKIHCGRLDFIIQGGACKPCF